MAAESVAPNLGGSRNPFNYEKFLQLNRDIATPWLTLNEITQHLNLFEDESQDDYLKILELATRQAIEDYLGLSIFPVQYRVWYSGQSMWGTPLTLDLPEVSQNYSPVGLGVTINQVCYWTGAFPPILNKMAITEYYYDPSGNKIVLQNLPTDLNMSITNPIFADYTTAASPIASYPVVKWAGLLMLTHLYNNRSNSTEKLIRDIPKGVDTLLRPYKPLVL